MRKLDTNTDDRSRFSHLPKITFGPSCPLCRQGIEEGEHMVRIVPGLTSEDIIEAAKLLPPDFDPNIDIEEHKQRRLQWIRFQMLAAEDNEKEFPEWPKFPFDKVEEWVDRINSTTKAQAFLLQLQDQWIHRKCVDEHPIKEAIYYLVYTFWGNPIKEAEDY